MKQSGDLDIQLPDQRRVAWSATVFYLTLKLI